MPVVGLLPSYPQPMGTRLICIAKYAGPAAYVQGGESLNATSFFGGGSFDKVAGGASFNANNSGNYNIGVRYPTGQAANNTTGGQTVNLVFTAANGTEAANNTNLSGEYAWIEMIGG